MKRGFTLLELLIVIIIVGVLATLGLTQYSSVVEKSRGAEARQIVGQLRGLCAGKYMETADTANCDNTNLSIGAGNDQIPSACRPSHFFSYAVSATNPSLTLTATRCTSGGKNPDAPTARALVLTANLQTGNATWSQTGAGGY